MDVDDYYLNINYNLWRNNLKWSHGHSCDRDRFLSENCYFVIPTRQNRGYVYNDAFQRSF